MKDGLTQRMMDKLHKQDLAAAQNWDGQPHRYYRLDGPTVAKTIGPNDPEYKTEGWFRIRTPAPHFNASPVSGEYREIMEARGMNINGEKISKAATSSSKALHATGVPPSSADHRPFVTQKAKFSNLASQYDAINGPGAAENAITAERNKSSTVASRWPATLKEKIGFLTNQLQVKVAAKASPKIAAPIATHAAPMPADAGKKIVAETMTRAEFQRLSPRKQLEFCRRGGRLRA